MTGNAPPRATVIIPACNEADHIGACLAAVLASEGDTPFETLVIANGCTDATASVARAFAAGLARPGRPVRVIERPEGGKPGALQTGDEAARARIRIYLDADVIVDAGLIPALVDALGVGPARLAGGVPRIPPPQSAISRAYARFWQLLPFVTGAVPAFGVFAVNAAGRARWGAWPDIVSDDTFARLSFAPGERVQVPQGYAWPVAEGFGNLVRVRRRQNRGVREVAARFPQLLRNRDRAKGGAWQKARAALADPAGFAVYALVALCVRLPSAAHGWERGR